MHTLVPLGPSVGTGCDHQQALPPEPHGFLEPWVCSVEAEATRGLPGAPETRLTCSSSCRMTGSTHPDRDQEQEPPWAGERWGQVSARAQRPTRPRTALSCSARCIQPAEFLAGQ